MPKHNQLDQRGSSGTIVALVLCVLLLIGALAFGGWAYSSRQDYKNNVDSKVASAVSTAKQQEDVRQQNIFAQEEKNPLRTYNGPEAYGSLAISYPRTWSAYVDDTDTNNNAVVDGYFKPGTVPSISNQSSTFALRVQVLNQSYTQSLQTIQQAQKSGSQGGQPLTVTAYALPKVPKAVGVEVTGNLPNQQQTNGTMVVLPLRSETLEIWTVGNQYLSDFNNIILANFSFSP